MNALEMAPVIEADCPFDLSEAAVLLRRQHEALVKLREALKEIQGYVLEHGAEYVVAEKALKDTEGL